MSSSVLSPPKHPGRMQHPIHKGHPQHHKHVEQCPAMPSEAGGHEDSGDTALMSPKGPLGWEEERLVPSLHGDPGTK